jgi:bifunctional non-homologous end joining protein LigD
MDLDRVRLGAEDLKSVLDSLSVKSYLKTSGGKGYHIVVPFKAHADWEAFCNFAKGVAEYMESKWPDRYTANVRKISRKGRIFIDWIRNTRGATSIAPYSVRARQGARVSMPIGWEELYSVAPDGITMEEAIRRLAADDPWKDFIKR